MGEVIRIHAQDGHVLEPGPERCPICDVVGTFRSRADAEHAAGLVADHLRFPGLVGIVKRRRRLGLRTRFELTVEETDVDRAVAVLRIAASCVASSVALTPTHGMSAETSAKLERTLILR